MQTSDRQLLRQYVEGGSQAAFGKLVERHMKMVYWTCRRDLKDADLADDAAQAVFVLLAQKAYALSPNVSISGWLFNTARFVAMRTLRSDSRRKRHEQEVAIAMSLSPKPEPSWDSIEPWLNDALSRLSHSDREALFLRYFEGMSAGEIAQATGSTDAAVRMRMSRALDKLRQYLLKREVAVAPAVLAALLAEHSAKAAPMDSSSAATHALRTARVTHALPALNPILSKGLLLMSTTKLIAGGAAAIILLLGLGLYGYHRAHALPPDIVWQAPPAYSGAQPSYLKWDVAPSADPATQAAQQQIKGELIVVADGLASADLNKYMSMFSPNFSNPGPVTSGGRRWTNMTYDLQKQLESEWLTGDPETVTMVVTACTINGNTAHIYYGNGGIVATNHKGRSNWGQDTLTKVGGQWLAVGTGH